jgi:DNA polymerase
MFIGEAPGHHEDRQGRPFVGAAGKLLDDLLARIDLGRDDVFITNVVKHRPPGNRDPEAEEIEACRPFLERQIELVNPTIIATLGRFAMERYLPGAKISQVHGQPRRLGDRLFVPLIHPAAALHRGDWRPKLEEDFDALRQLLDDQAAQVPDAESEDVKGEQLSMF